jgi:hypothetical protein
LSRQVELVEGEGERAQPLTFVDLKIYAMTSSPLKIKLLSLFSVDQGFNFANMISFALTRDSVRSALDRGITGESILDFLVANAHPWMRALDPILPPNVTDRACAE